MKQEHMRRLHIIQKIIKQHTEKGKKVHPIKILLEVIKLEGIKVDWKSVAQQGHKICDELGLDKINKEYFDALSELDQGNQDPVMAYDTSNSSGNISWPTVVIVIVGGALLDGPSPVGDVLAVVAATAIIVEGGSQGGGSGEGEEEGGDGEESGEGGSEGEGSSD